MRRLIAAFIATTMFGFAGVAAAQDSVQNAAGASAQGGKAASQSVAAASVVPASMVATGSVVVGASVTTAGDASIVTGVDTSKSAVDSAAFARGPLNVDRTVVVLSLIHI